MFTHEEYLQEKNGNQFLLNKIRISTYSLILNIKCHRFWKKLKGIIPESLKTGKHILNVERSFLKSSEK